MPTSLTGAVFLRHSVYSLKIIMSDHNSRRIGCHRLLPTRGSAMAEGPRDALVSRNSATTQHTI